MVNCFLKIYDYFKSKHTFCLAILVLLLISFIGLTLSLQYKEDIYDFLPFNSERQKEMKIYQGISHADRVLVTIQLKDTLNDNSELLLKAVDHFASIALKIDSGNRIKDLTTSIEYDQIVETIDYVYHNIPFFLTEKDYLYLDSLITPQYIKEQLERNKEMLLLPTGGMLSNNIQRDPLNIFTPTVSKLQQVQSDIQFDILDGYILSPDNKRAYVYFTTPYGASETSNNGELMSLLEDIFSEIESKINGVKFHAIGASIIAVNNASQIKKDSILAVFISVTIILLLLLHSFRNIKSLMLIVISILVGWCFAMACMSLIHDRVSIIVLGIASVIIGIAVNYPLHFLAHLKHVSNTRLALKEIISPLLIGNITTVGAFACLIPLDSIALRDLGLFSSFMLIGTILFVLIFLPHIINNNTIVENKNSGDSLLLRLANISFDNKPWFIIMICIFTVILGYFSQNTSFDADISNINYMTEQQRADMNEMQGKLNSDTTTTIYVASEGSVLNDAISISENAQQYLENLVKGGKANRLISATRFVPSKNEQIKRLNMWKQFIADKNELLTSYFSNECIKQGFNASSFYEYNEIIQAEYSELDSLNTMIQTIFPNHVIQDSLNVIIVDMLNVPILEKDIIIEQLRDNLPHSHSFDMRGMNEEIANTLSDNFNYIVFSCGFIVFIFLWLSFGRIELSIMAFMPMAISWIWILGIMSVLNIQFNIVNVILATFIFGQGDDYTIFMTEGLIYEYAHKKKMLASYKSSIILSALIMFVGIGSLITANHPALFSLAEVTVVGMFSVVLMTYIIPPLIFNWLIRRNGLLRQVPITLERFLFSFAAGFVYISQIIVGLFMGAILFTMFGKRTWTRKLFHAYIHVVAKLDCKIFIGTRIRIRNEYDEMFNQGCIIIANHQSILDSLLLMAISPKILLVSNSKVWNNPIVHGIMYMADFICIEDGAASNENIIAESVSRGYSVAIFPEGKRTNGDSIERFHRGAFYLAERIKADIVPIYLHGVSHVLPSHNILRIKGRIDVIIGKRIMKDDLTYGLDYKQRARSIGHMFRSYYGNYQKEFETSSYFKSIIINKYLYKGVNVEKSIRKELKKYNNYSLWVDTEITNNNIVIINNRYGVAGLLFALVHPHKKVYTYEPDPEMSNISSNLAYLPNNLFILDKEPTKNTILDNSSIYLIEPNKVTLSKYKIFNPIIIKLKHE